MPPANVCRAKSCLTPCPQHGLCRHTCNTMHTFAICRATNGTCATGRTSCWISGKQSWYALDSHWNPLLSMFIICSSATCEAVLWINQCQEMGYGRACSRVWGWEHCLRMQAPHMQACRFTSLSVECNVCVPPQEAVAGMFGVPRDQMIFRQPPNSPPEMMPFWWVVAMVAAMPSTTACSHLLSMTVPKKHKTSN